LINPDGVGIWKTGIGFLGNQYLVSHTAEYLPPDFQNPSFWPFLALIGLSILVLGMSQRRMKFAHMFLMGSWTAMALVSARNIPLYVVVVIPILCSLAAKIVKESRRFGISDWFVSFQNRISLTEKDLKGGLLAAMIAILSIYFLMKDVNLDFQNRGNVFAEEVFPVGAADWMEENPITGNGFNHFPWGGYLLYRFWPDQLVFIDGQTDFYGEDLTRQYEQVITLRPGWQHVFSRYDIEWVLVPAESPLALYLEPSGDWVEIFSDDTAVIYKLAEEH
jgi:hypothetical protein